MTTTCSWSDATQHLDAVEHLGSTVRRSLTNIGMRSASANACAGTESADRSEGVTEPQQSVSAVAGYQRLYSDAGRRGGRASLRSRTPGSFLQDVNSMPGGPVQSQDARAEKVKDDCRARSTDRASSSSSARPLPATPDLALALHARSTKPALPARRTRPIPLAL